MEIVYQPTLKLQNRHTPQTLIKEKFRINEVVNFRHLATSFINVGETEVDAPTTANPVEVVEGASDEVLNGMALVSIEVAVNVLSLIDWWLVVTSEEATVVGLRGGRTTWIGRHSNVSGKLLVY